MPKKKEQGTEAGEVIGHIGAGALSTVGAYELYRVARPDALSAVKSAYDRPVKEAGYAFAKSHFFTHR